MGSLWFLFIERMAASKNPLATLGSRLESCGPRELGPSGGFRTPRDCGVVEEEIAGQSVEAIL
jgi:hypothetical protein